MIDLIELGGFPEPSLSGSRREARRWSREYGYPPARLVRLYDEVTTLERIQNLGQLELMMLSLPERVGSPLSVNALNALREDLQVSHKTANA